MVIYRPVLKYKMKYTCSQKYIKINQSNERSKHREITFVDLYDKNLSDEQKFILNILNIKITNDLYQVHNNIIDSIQNVSLQKFIIYYNEATFDTIKIGESPFHHCDIEQTKHALEIISKVLAKYNITYNDNKYVYKMNNYVFKM